MSNKSIFLADFISLPGYNVHGSAGCMPAPTPLVGTSDADGTHCYRTDRARRTSLWYLLPPSQGANHLLDGTGEPQWLSYSRSIVQRPSRSLTMISHVILLPSLTMPRVRRSLAVVTLFRCIRYILDSRLIVSNTNFVNHLAYFLFESTFNVPLVTSFAFFMIYPYYRRKTGWSLANTNWSLRSYPPGYWCVHLAYGSM